MKSLTAPVHESHRYQKSIVQNQIPDMVISVREILALLSAVTVATAAVMLSVWVTALSLGGIVGALTWGLAFVFFAMAVDRQPRVALLQLATGASLIALAWLQSAVSPEYTIVSGILLAAWAAVAVFKRLK